MVFAVLVADAGGGGEPTQVLFSQLYDGDAAHRGGDVRAARKERMALAAARVASEMEFVVQTGDHQPHATLATGEDRAGQHGGAFCMGGDQVFAHQKTVLWQSHGRCVVAFLCEASENNVLAESVLNQFFKRLLATFKGISAHPAEVSGKLDEVAAFLHVMMPNGQLLFANQRLLTQKTTELDHFLSAKN